MENLRLNNFSELYTYLNYSSTNTILLLCVKSFLSFSRLILRLLSTINLCRLIKSGEPQKCTEFKSISS